MMLKSVAERIEREFRGLLSYGNLRKLKFRKIVSGNTEEEIYEQAVIYAFMRKNGYRSKEILEARRYWSGEREDKHFIAIMLSFGLDYRKEGISKKERETLRKIGQAILTYGYYLHSIRSGIDFVNNEVSFRITLRGSNLIYAIREVRKREKSKTKEKEYILSL
jgi:hypothetical protein